MRAIDIDCPRGHAPAGTVCNGWGIGVDLCQTRINKVVAMSREANRARKKQGKAKR